MAPMRVCCVPSEESVVANLLLLVSCVSEDRRLNESRICCVFSSPTHLFFFFQSETSGLVLATLQAKLALCTALVLPGGVCEGIINEVTDSRYLALQVGCTCASGQATQLAPGCCGSCQGHHLWLGEASPSLGFLVKDLQ